MRKGVPSCKQKRREQSVVKKRNNSRIDDGKNAEAVVFYFYMEKAGFYRKVHILVRAYVPPLFAHKEAGRCRNDK